MHTMAKKPRLTITKDEANLNRLSSFRCSINRPRSSVISSYAIDLSAEETILNDVDEEDQNDALQCYLMKTTWNICRVSPLFNFSYNRTKLKQYALKIKQYIAANHNANSATEYKVNVNVVKHLKTEIKHSDAIQINVLSGNSSCENFKQLYQCLIFSWGSYNEQEGNLTYLPVMFDCGQAKAVATVRSCLKKMFDCVISPLSLTQSEMLFFTALLSSYSPKDGNKEVKFMYNVPIVPKTSINFTLMSKYIYKMWLSCFPKNNPAKTINDKTAWKMYNIIQRYMQHVYQIDVGRLELVELKYPGVTLQNHGKIQLNDLEIARPTLRILSQMSVILKGSKPNLEADD